MEVRNLQLPDTRLGGPTQADHAHQVHRPGAAGATAVAPPPAGDSVTISPEARQAVVVDSLVQQVLRLPDARPDVVSAARAALERGAFDSPEAIQASVAAVFEAR